MLLRLEHISKSFGEIKSLIDVDFEIDRGEIVGLLGDNGAGKSTLIKIITGFHRCDDGGKVYWNDQPVHLTVSSSRKLGIETVYQERALAEQQSIWRNIFMGREASNFGFMQLKQMKQDTNDLMRLIGFTGASVNADKIVNTMSGGERQGIAIARALHFNAELIILDEPTMGLSIYETQKTLSFIREIKRAGKSCIFIDHNVYHVYSVADRIVVIDKGKIVGQFRKDEISLEELSEKLYTVARTGVI